MSFNPEYYERTESLLNVYDVQPKIGAINVQLSSDELGGHRVGNDYIYEYIFLLICLCRNTLVKRKIQLGNLRGVRLLDI